MTLESLHTGDYEQGECEHTPYPHNTKYYIEYRALEFEKNYVQEKVKHTTFL